MPKISNFINLVSWSQPELKVSLEAWNKRIRVVFFFKKNYFLSVKFENKRMTCGTGRRRGMSFSARRFSLFGTFS